MSCKPNPENVRMIAETQSLIDQGMKPKDALKLTGLKPSTWRSHCERIRVRKEDELAWSRLGVTAPDKINRRVVSKVEKDRP